MLTPPVDAEVARPSRKVVDLHFQDAQLSGVVRGLAKAMNRDLYLDPSVERRVTLEVHHTPPEAALALMLALEDDLDYKFTPHGVLIVAPRAKIAEVEEFPLLQSGCHLRQVGDGLVFASTPGAKIVSYLESEFPQLVFVWGENGFVLVVATSSDFASLKSALDFDNLPDPPLHTLRYTSPSDAEAWLNLLLPEAQIVRLGNLILVKGYSLEVSQIAELIDQLDRPPKGQAGGIP
jgi:type II secretory pathway component GspD/PulD (secretin)